MGFSIAPNPNCPHIASSSFQICPVVGPSKSGADGKAPRRNLYSENCACDTCGDSEETWVCIVCGFSGCSRYKGSHMVSHSTTKSSEHPEPVIGISLTDLSTWCFACDDYITHPKLETVFREFHRGKFGYFPSGELHTAAEDHSGAFLTIEKEDPDTHRHATDAKGSEST